MKIMLYNIDHGGNDGKQLKIRWSKLIKTIRSINPDIAIILEAWNWKQSKELKEFSQKTDFKYFSLSKSNTKHHIALMSKIKPVKVAKFKPGFHHSVLKADFKTSIPFTIFGIHLTPKTEDVRLKEIKKIIKLAKQKNTLILGDFNSLSFQDNYNEKNLIKNLQREKIIKFGDKKIEKRVIKEVIKSGLIDIYKKQHNDDKVHHSVPTKMCIDKDHLTKLRLDYAMVSKPLAKLIAKTQIVKNRQTNISSDHFPLIIEIPEK